MGHTRVPLREQYCEQRPSVRPPLQGRQSHRLHAMSRAGEQIKRGVAGATGAQTHTRRRHRTRFKGTWDQQEMENKQHI